MYLVDAPPPSSLSQGRAAGQTLCVSTRPLVPGEALYLKHRQPLNTHGVNTGLGVPMFVEYYRFHFRINYIQIPYLEVYSDSSSGSHRFRFPDNAHQIYFQLPSKQGAELLVEKLPFPFPENDSSREGGNRDLVMGF